MVARGASANRRGKVFERELARWLTDTTGLEVASTRRVLRGVGADFASRLPDGTWTPVVLGWAIEAKAESTGFAPDRWLEQATRQAAEIPDAIGGVVIAKRPNRAVADAWAIVRLADLLDNPDLTGWTCMPAATFIKEIA